MTINSDAILGLGLTKRGVFVKGGKLLIWLISVEPATRLLFEAKFSGQTCKRKARSLFVSGILNSPRSGSVFF